MLFSVTLIFTPLQSPWVMISNKYLTWSISGFNSKSEQIYDRMIRGLFWLLSFSCIWNDVGTTLDSQISDHMDLVLTEWIMLPIGHQTPADLALQWWMVIYIHHSTIAGCLPPSVSLSLSSIWEKYFDFKPSTSFINLYCSSGERERAHNTTQQRTISFLLRNQFYSILLKWETYYLMIHMTQ